METTMVEPTRLLRDGATPFESRLLSSARHDAPSPGRRRHIVAGLGLGGALGGAIASTSKASTLTLFQRLAGTAITRWAIVGGAGSAVTAAAVWTSVQLSQPSAAASNAAPHKALVVQPVSAPPAATEEPSAAAPETQAVSAPAMDISELAPAAAAEAAATPRARSRHTATDISPLAQELRALEAARRALVQGDPRRSLSLLDEHTAKFSKPRLTAEATVLRIEALTASGETARAHKLGKAFLARHANGPYERRVRSLIGETKEPRVP